MELHLPVVESVSAVEHIAAQCDLSHTRIKRVMQCGAVWRTRGGQTARLRKASSTLVEGDELHLYYRADLIDAVMPEPVLLCDEGNYSVWHKPAGVPCQGSKYGDHHTLQRLARLAENSDRNNLLVHRLDRFTFGVCLLAHSKTAQRKLSELFETRNMDKQYHALCDGHPSQGLLPAIVDLPIDGRAAHSEVNLLAVNQEHSKLSVRITTGRKHQVRIHLASLKLPVIGDRQHGNPADQRDLQLCAHSLGFRCPLSGDKKSYQAEQSLLPPQWQNFEI
ncbi:MAG: RluA family pseudouridine synthase [Pseudomonadales bacterium]